MTNAPAGRSARVLALRVQQTALGAGDETACAVVARAPVGKPRDLHARAGVRRVDEAALPDVHPDVAEPAEEDEVAGLQRPAPDPPAEVEVRVRAVRQVDPEPPVDITNEPGAVEAARTAATPAVRDADEVPGIGGCTDSDRKLRRLLQAEPAAPVDAEANRLALDLRLRGEAGGRPEDECVRADERKQEKSQCGGHEEAPFGVGRRRNARRWVVGQAAGNQRAAEASMGPRRPGS